MSPDRAVFDENAARPVVVPGRYTFAAGASSRDLADHETFEVGRPRR